MQKRKRIHVYNGNLYTEMVMPFKYVRFMLHCIYLTFIYTLKAIQRLIKDGHEFELNFVNSRSVLCNNWNEKGLTDWLLDCDGHIILTHIHQGMY